MVLAKLLGTHHAEPGASYRHKRGRAVRVMDLIERAVEGDRQALERLLLVYHPRIKALLQRQLPTNLRARIEVDDVLQETYSAAFKGIRSFRPGGEQAFGSWLETIARHRMLDLLKRERREKRGGNRQAVQSFTDRSSFMAMVEHAAVNRHTPSRSAAFKEAAAAVHVSLAGLKEDYRKALQLRYLQGLNVAEVASRMGRSRGAVRMLCCRGLKELQAALGRSIDYLESRS